MTTVKGCLLQVNSELNVLPRYAYPFTSEKEACKRGQVFGPASDFNIGYILAEQPQSNGDRTRPLDTVTPLANELGLKVDASWYVNFGYLKVYSE